MSGTNTKQTVPYADLLGSYANAEPLPDTINPDGKSLYNPPGPLSPTYDTFPHPIDSSNNGFDFHGASSLFNLKRHLITVCSLLYAGGRLAEGLRTRLT